MVDLSIKCLVNILYEILVRLDKFIFLYDFVILDWVQVPIILSKLFLATNRAFVDVESGEINFKANGKEVGFNVCKSMKQPSDIYLLTIINVVDKAIASVSEVVSVGKTLVVVILNYNGEDIHDYDEVLQLCQVWVLALQIL